MKHEKQPSPEIQPSDDESLFVSQVVNQVQIEIGSQLSMNPGMSVQEIKIQAMDRFLDLIQKELLTQREAEKCYIRFAHMVDYYYGT